MVGLSKLSDVTFSSRVVNFADGGVCSLVGEQIPPYPEEGVSMIVPDSGTGPIQSSEPLVQGGKSLAGLFKSSPVENLPVPLPSKKRGYVFVLVDPAAYQARLELCRNAIIGCVVLSSDFNPSLQKSTNAHVWVRFFDLSWEYWHPKLISDLATGIEVPLRLDKATSDWNFGHFARVLVDVDVLYVLPTLVLLERDEFHSCYWYNLRRWHVSIKNRVIQNNK
ncbi:hypothetical protein Dsin_021779 [Dipteronia sinensis]|uniref:DUF4283 domain-containing protein n=1 Tax=Dipteronia sinensis TaxID=43782 RepID=A0AAE0A0D5_9ROSI|nr:hypothetical protein Dsin_021779 [Dipteronia sinensis]